MITEKEKEENLRPQRRKTTEKEKEEIIWRRKYLLWRRRKGEKYLEKVFCR